MPELAKVVLESIGEDPVRADANKGSQEPR